MHQQENIQQSQTTSKYNEAANQIARLDEAWRDARKNREAGKLKFYKENLDSIELELCVDAIKLISFSSTLFIFYLLLVIAFRVIK